MKRKKLKTLYFNIWGFSAILIKLLFYKGFIFLTFLLVNCNSTSTKNQLDTAKGQFTKDMVSEPSITTSLKLSDDEMNTIYSEMKRINILDYPDSFNPKYDCLAFRKTSNMFVVFSFSCFQIH